MTITNCTMKLVKPSDNIEDLNVIFIRVSLLVTKQF